MIGPASGRKRKTRERVYGVIMRSLESSKWEVQWAGGQYEALTPGSLRNGGGAHLRPKTSWGLIYDPGVSDDKNFRNKYQYCPSFNFVLENTYPA